MKKKEKSIMFTSLSVLIFFCTIHAESTEFILPTSLPQNYSLGISFHSVLTVSYETKLPPQILSRLSFFQREQNFESQEIMPEIKDISSLPSRQKLLEKHSRTGSFENSLFQTSLITFIALNIADYYSTREALKYPGLGEGNPLLKPFVKDPYIFATFKFGLTALNYISMKAIYKKNKKLAWVITTLSNFALSYVVINNFRLIQKVKNR
jgi:hypothetical protein